MTIAMAAICSADNSTQTGEIVVCTDTRLAWELSTSNEGGTKLYDLPHGFFMTVGDSVSKCHQFNGYLYEQMSAISVSDPGFVELTRLAIQDANELCRVWMRAAIIGQYGITIDEYLHDEKLVNREIIRQRLEEEALEIDVIICGFSPKGEPMMFQTNGMNICECAVPGFACAGSGAPVALDWLNFRQQNSFMSTQRTFYHIREAHRHAGLSIGVGDTCNMLLLRHNQSPVDIGTLTPLLQQWVNNFYPRLTDALDGDGFYQEFAITYLNVATSPTPKR